MWLLIYFGMSYVGTEEANRYGKRAFALDLIETGIIFLCFVSLGYVTEVRDANFNLIFLMLALTIPLQFVWRKVTRSTRKSFNLLGIVAAVACVGAAIASPSFPDVAPITGTVVLYLLLAVYLYERRAATLEPTSEE